MSDTFTVDFSSQEEVDLVDEFVFEEPESEPQELKRHIVHIPLIEDSSPALSEEAEKRLHTKKQQLPKLPEDVKEGAKALFTSSGGNINEVCALYDLTPQVVLQFATLEEWPIYNGTTKLHDSKSRSQLISFRNKIWRKVEKMLDAMDVEEKEKDDIVQYRSFSKYVEPLASRSSAFKILMDQYMRISTILEPEFFGRDPDGGNYIARRENQRNYPGGIEGVNREMADLLSEVVVGVADKLKDRELKGYGHVIDARGS